MTLLSTLTDTELLSNTQTLRLKEKKILLELLLHIQEIDERKLYRDSGYSSLFVYLTDKLSYSAGAACRRMQLARGIKKYPEVYAALEAGNLTFYGAVLIVKCTEIEDINELIARCAGKSGKEIEVLTAPRSAPSVSKKESIRPVRVSKKSYLKAKTDLEPSLFDGGSMGDQKLNTTTVEVPLEKELCYDVTHQVDEEFMELYLEIKALVGGRDMKSVLKKVMKEYVVQKSPKERQKRREQRKAKRTAVALEKAPKAKRSRYIPIEMRDLVFLGDEGRCTYVSEDGTRCACKEGLEVDHISPFALHGEHELSNLRLLCKTHNLLEAERVFGRVYIEKFTSRE
jgi:5-methylcytosine-specific restriction endonuclease McrA